MKVGAGVEVAVRVWEGVAVGRGARVEVALGVKVLDPVGTASSPGEGVWEGVWVGVREATVDVGRGVEEGTGVRLGVGLGVREVVAVGGTALVRVGVGVPVVVGMGLAVREAVAVGGIVLVCVGVVVPVAVGMGLGVRVGVGGSPVRVNEPEVFHPVPMKICTS